MSNKLKEPDRFFMLSAALTDEDKKVIQHALYMLLGTIGDDVWLFSDVSSDRARIVAEELLTSFENFEHNSRIIKNFINSKKDGYF